MTLPFNKVCELEDFADPELRSLIAEIFPETALLDASPDVLPDSKHWEIAMSCRALREFGCLRRDAAILGVGAGTEATSFYLTRHVRQVVATDLYLSPGPWADVAPPLMLVEPEQFAPSSFERDRLVVQHMDGRRLRYPDESFDGIFSSGSIEHFGSLELIANAAFEMGRVLKPGGILTLSTEFKISGPPGEDGWDTGTHILSEDRIRRYIVDASGLELVDELRTTLSEPTMRSERDLTAFLRDSTTATSLAARAAVYPNLVLVHEGYVFCSVHLTLRKTERYPATDNEWARPSRDTDRAIAVEARRIESTAFGPPAPSPKPASADGWTATEVARLLREWDSYFTRVLNDPRSKRLPRPLARIYRTLLRVRYLGAAWQTESVLLHTLVERSFVDPEEVARTREELSAETARVREHATDAAEANRQALEALRAQVVALRSEDRQRETFENDDAQAAVKRLETQLMEIGSQLAALTETTAELRNRYDDQEQRLREAVSGLRLATYERRTGDDERDGDLTGREMVEVINAVEERVPDLAKTTAVEVSVEPASAEPALVEACEHLGERLSARPPEYRMPNDAWYHFDLAGRAAEDQLLDDAAAKLVPGGFLVLVDGETAEGSSVAHPAFSTVLDSAFPAGDRTVHVCVLQTPPPE